MSTNTDTDITQMTDGTDARAEYQMDRTRGISTEGDRKFLCGQVDFSDEQSRRNARYRVRNRVKDAILDLQIIANEMPERDLRMVLDSLSEEERSGASDFARRVAPEPIDTSTEAQLRELVQDELSKQDQDPAGECR